MAALMAPECDVLAHRLGGDGTGQQSEDARDGHESAKQQHGKHLVRNWEGRKWAARNMRRDRTPCNLLSDNDMGCRQGPRRGERSPATLAVAILYNVAAG